MTSIAGYATYRDRLIRVLSAPDDCMGLKIVTATECPWYRTECGGELAWWSESVDPMSSGFSLGGGELGYVVEPLCHEDGRWLYRDDSIPGSGILLFCGYDEKDGGQALVVLSAERRLYRGDGQSARMEKE